MTHKPSLEKKLKEISTVLDNEYKNEENVGVLAGISGMALFYFYYSKYLDTDTHADKGVSLLEEVVERINNGYQFPTFCTGIAGAGWVFEHLLEEDLMDSDNDELLADLDNYLFEVMNYEMHQGKFDFLHAGIGYAYYFLKRYKNTKQKELKERYGSFLEKMITDLEKTAHTDDNGLKWESTLDIETGLKGYNLSLSHGISSIIIFLAKVHEVDHLKDRVETLLKGAISFVKSHQINDDGIHALYPSWITDPPQQKSGSRLAWCYGDLGIGLAFWHTSKALNDDSLKNEALAIFQHAASRKTDTETGVMDAGVCHGSYGNSQIFNRIYKETKDPIYKEAAYYWIDHGLKLGFHEDGFAGYKQWNGKDKDWDPRASVLEGVAGIGLSIIDHLAEFDSHWDECLMIS